MSNELFAKLEQKIHLTLETIDYLRLQNQELQDKNKNLLNELNILRKRQNDWEDSIANLVHKLDSADIDLADESMHHETPEKDEAFSL